MSPATVFLSIVLALSWFVGAPFAVAYGEDGDGNLLAGFAVIWGSTVGVIVVVALLLWWDARWERKRARERGEQ